MNFVPKMDLQELMEGYKKIIRNIYATKPYYYKRSQRQQTKIEFFHLGAFIKSMVIIGMLNKGIREYWKLMVWTLLRRPSLLFDAITFAVYGYHFRIIYGLTRNR